MTDIVERMREAAANLSEIYPDYAEAADEITRLREENAKLREAAIPICVGRPIISILAREGAWTSASGASIVTASELFCNDPYEEIERLREALKPFAGMAQHCEGMSDSESQCVFVGDLRAARAALKGEK